MEQRRKEIEATEPIRDAMVAAMGWCAPSETDYSICLQITTDGLADFPEVQARRGGIRHNTGIEFDSIFGGGSCSSPTGFFDLTEAEVASGTVKTCLEIDCPDFVDTRLGVTGLCLTGNILAIRGYPEYTATFTRGALAASAHQINREQIAAVVADSTAVTLSGAPWATDLSVVSQVMSAVEMAIVDIKYRLRMQQSATLEVIMPFWILAQMRADWIRRNATGGWADSVMVADSEISAGFARRGARVQYVYDWQDAFATCAASGRRVRHSVGCAADLAPVHRVPGGYLGSGRLGCHHPQLGVRLHEAGHQPGHSPVHGDGVGDGPHVPALPRLHRDHLPERLYGSPAGRLLLSGSRGPGDRSPPGHQAGKETAWPSS